MNHNDVIRTHASLLSQVSNTLPDPQLNEGDTEMFGRAKAWREALDGYRAEMTAAQLSPLTMRGRRYQLGVFAEDHIRKHPWKVTRADIIDWLGSRDWSRSTVSVYRATVREFYSWARISGQIRKDPAADLPTIAVPDRVPHPVPDAVVIAAIELATQRDELILCAGRFMGLRRAEIAAIRFDHNDGANLRVTGKGSKTRLIPVHQTFATALQAEQERRADGGYGTGWWHPPAHDDGYLFPAHNTPTGHLIPEVIGRSAAKALGTPWTTHSLRHAYLSSVYEISGDIRSVAELAGHVKLDTSRGYAQMPTDALRNIVNQMH